MSRLSIHPVFSLLFYALLAFGTVEGAGPTWAQPGPTKALRGRVVDAETGKPLPQANLRIAGTYRGTITNQQGHYTLEVDSLPATLVVRYLGYETARRRITEASDPVQSFRLTPSAVKLEEVVVTGSGNPGETIMQRVIEHKQKWWPELKSYAVEAYNRFTLGGDTTIAAIAESQATAFWDAERGTREVVRDQRGTARLSQLLNQAPEGVSLPAAATVLNLYRDNVEIFGNRMVGVTHPDALDYYSFSLDMTRAIDGRRAYRIRVEPESRLSSTFQGTVTVLDSTYALIEAHLRPTAALGTTRLFKQVDIAFEQQFSNFGGPYWLPVDFRARRGFDLQVPVLGNLSDVRIRQVSRLSEYRINVSVPDSLYDSKEDSPVVGVDTVRALRLSANQEIDSLGGEGPFVPYSATERSAYARRDSTNPLGSFFQRRYEPLCLWSLQELGAGDNLFGDDRFFGGDQRAPAEDSISLGVEWLDPIFRYNRVEVLHLGDRLTLSAGPVEVSARGSFSTAGPIRWSYGATLNGSSSSGTSLTFNYHYGIDPRYRARSRLAPGLARLTNTLWTLSGEPDYFDYFGNERLRFSVQQEVPGLGLELGLQFRNERHFSVDKTTDYDLFGRGQTQPSNPPIQPGWMRSVALTATVGGEGLLGITPLNQVQVSVEHSAPRFGSDFDFTRLEVVADAHVGTFFQRRLRPNSLDLRLDVGTSLGTVPLQRFGVVEASPLPFTPFGALRTLDDRPYQGEHHAALFWEHNFRTVPFELLGWEALVERNVEVILHGGHGRTWIEDATARHLARRGVQLRTSDEIHHGLGVSINGLCCNSLRLDVTKRLDAKGLSISLSAVRLF